MSSVLEGSIQRQDDRVRVTAQLVEAASGAHVWSERWERSATDILRYKSEVAERRGSLGGDLAMAAIASSELRRARRRLPADLTAYDHYLIAAEGKASFTEAAVTTGLRHADQAIALDPSFARAYVARGWLRYLAAASAPDWAAAMEQAAIDFRKALELDPTDAEARAGLGTYLAETGRLPGSSGRGSARHSTRSGRPHVLVAGAANLPYLGQPEEGAALAHRALRLDPHAAPGVRAASTHAYFYARRFERLIAVVETVPEESRRPFARLALAASYAFEGRSQEAEAAKAAFAAKHGTPSAELWLNQGYAFARQQERDLLVGAFPSLTSRSATRGRELEGVANPVRLPRYNRAARQPPGRRRRMLAAAPPVPSPRASPKNFSAQTVDTCSPAGARGESSR